MTCCRPNLLLIIGVALALGLITPPTISSSHALTSEEMLAEPDLEKRARNLSKQIRCLVCQNQSIDDSDADLARDLRREVRLQLIAGKTDDAILSELRAKYGDYVLLAPPLAGYTIALWLSPVGFIIFGIAVALGIRRRDTSTTRDIISSSDRAKIDALKQQYQKVDERNRT